MNLFKRIALSVIALFTLMLLSFSSAGAQVNRDNSQSRVSPNASVSQTIGTTVVTIRYSRPSVRDRKIFGGLVPFGEVWRAGANEATSITFSRDVKVEGQELPAGDYSFFTIPDKDQWTLIFNKSIKWGTSYDKSADVLRVKVSPEESPEREQLMYYFRDVNEGSGSAVLTWAGTAVPFTISVADGGK